MFSRADETAGDIPVKDLTVYPSAKLQESLVAQNVRERQSVSKLSREELEDKYLRLQEENLALKQHTSKQEDKIRRMATKLLRLVKDRKRSECGRDVDLEELMEEQQEKLQELEKKNEALRRRLLSSRQQLQSRTHTPYTHVLPRTHSGLRRAREHTPGTAHTRPHTPGTGSALRHVEGEMSSRPPQGLPRYGHSLLDEARAEIRNLENVLERQRMQMEEQECVSQGLREQLQRRERELEETLLMSREQQSSGQRSTIKENVEMIKLQKLLSEKANTLTVLEGRFLQQQESMKTLKASHDAALMKVDEVSVQLKEERMRSLQLETQIQSRALELRHAQELQERIQDLEKERDLLKENCDKLVKSAFDVSQEQKWRTREQQLKLQIAQLETALKSDLTDKNQILDKIKAERDLNENLTQENQQLQLRFLEQKQQLEEIKDRMKFFSKESEIDAAELSEALMLIKVRRSQRSGELGFIQTVEEDVKLDEERCLRELQATHAETVQELEKTRNMLFIQHKINKDYQAEVEAVTRAMDDLKLDYELKSEKLAHLLDVRAAKIKKLEAQMKDIAYGTKTHVFRPEETSDGVSDEFEESLHLSRGENLLEIHLGRAQFTAEALEALKDREPSTFCTYAFYDFELQSSGVVRGAQPDFSCTSQFVVHVDELFLNYLQCCSVTLELQLAEGLSFSTAAAGQIPLHPLLERDGPVFSSLQLIGVSGEIQTFGSLEYWIKLKLPIEQTVRLYKERVRALGLLKARDTQAPVGDLNELSISVHSCCDLRPRGPHLQPRAYVVYRLQPFADHDTPIAPCSCEPEFEDHTLFPLAASAELDSFLRSEEMLFYVFDDLDSEEQLYLGKARVRLAALAHGRPISGEFELHDPSGQPSGRIRVTLKWKLPYHYPSSSAAPTHYPSSSAAPTHYPSSPAAPTHYPSSSAASTQQTEIRKRETPQNTEETPPQPALSQTPMPKPRQRTLPKPTAKRVSFVDATELEKQMELEDDEVPGPSPKTVTVMDVKEREKEKKLEEEEEEEAHVSEGQLISSSLSDSEISEELQESITDVQAEEDDDSDDCIVPAQKAPQKKQPSESIRVEIVSLSLTPGSRVLQDSGIVRLFVEYSFLGLPSVETPLSLRKPPAGHSVSYNFSNVIHVDRENNQSRRQTLRAVLEGRNRQMEHIKFTVVSDPPEEAEQEEECEEVGVAYLRILDVLDKQRDLKDVSLNIVSVEDSSAVVGHLLVTVEALEALTSIMKDPERDRPPTTLA